MEICEDTIGVLYFGGEDVAVVWGNDGDEELISMPIDFCFIPIWGHC